MKAFLKVDPDHTQPKLVVTLLGNLEQLHLLFNQMLGEAAAAPGQSTFTGAGEVLAPPQIFPTTTNQAVPGDSRPPPCKRQC